MKRVFLSLLRVALLTMLTLLSLSVGGRAQQAEPRIASPQMNAEVRGKVLINGTAILPEFDYYKVEFGIGANPTDWALIGAIQERPVTDGLLGTWDTTVIPDGIYSLRLRVVKPDGNYVEYLVPQVKVVNTMPTATPTPTVTVTIPPTVMIVIETSTPVVERPTVPLAQPTATPTLARPTRAVASPFGDVREYGNALFLGAAATGVVFVLVGLILAIRRLL